jgi:membrane protease YdiL (CAAX protease family)
MRLLARRHPIAVFLALVFGLGVPLMLSPTFLPAGSFPIGALSRLLGREGEIAASLLLVWGALVPAALITSGLEGGPMAVVALLRRATIWRIGVGWWALILLALPATTVGVALLLGDTLRSLTFDSLATEIGGFFLGLALFNLAEEVSWAGFFQTRLERRSSLYRAALLTALPFAAIHLPLAVISGVTAAVALIVQFVFLVVLGVVVRLLVGLVLRGTANSLLAVGVLHTVFNRCNNPTGIAAKLLNGTHRPTAALVATVLLVVILGVTLRKRASPAERARLDAENGESGPAHASVYDPRNPRNSRSGVG